MSSHVYSRANQEEDEDDIEVIQEEADALDEGTRRTTGTKPSNRFLPRPSSSSPSSSWFPSRSRHRLFNRSTLLNPERWGTNGGDGDGAGPENRVPYSDKSSVDWISEYAKERQRLQVLRDIKGLRGMGLRLWDSSKGWIVVLLTGVSVGILAACLDILSAWLSDLRGGFCPSAFYLNRNVCCTGLDPGEPCYAWMTWADAFSLKATAARAIIQYAFYILSAVGFAGIAALFVQVYAPYAFHTGLPEIKVILSGYVIRSYLGPWTLAIKSLGLSLAVASGLSLGKEGPLVHVACCIGNIFMKIFEPIRNNAARQRELLSAAAAAGISVAFGAPLGGVLFSLEELSTYFPDTVLWQSFVCAIISAASLQYMDPFRTGKLVLFAAETNQVWRAFEILPWLFLGICGGLWGHLFIQLNIEYAKLRRQTSLRWFPILEVVVVAFFTALMSYLVGFLRIPTSELVANLFQACGPNDPYGLCDRDRDFSIISLLLLTVVAKTALTAVTFGLKIPAGIFLPSTAIGACFGRAVGVAMAALQRRYPTFFLFSSCPPDGPCVSPNVYAVIGASSFLAGVTRMTIAIVGIFFELTGAVDLVLQIMMAVMLSKFSGDFFEHNGIYEAWIHLRNYPFLSNKLEYRRDEVLAKDVMTKGRDLVVLPDKGWGIRELESFLEKTGIRGFPIVRSEKDMILLGFIARNELEFALGEAKRTLATADSVVYFTKRDKREAEEESILELVQWVDQTPMTTSMETPMEIVVQLFQRLGLRYILLTWRGALKGLLTKNDVYHHARIGLPSSTRESLRQRRDGRVDLVTSSIQTPDEDEDIRRVS